MSRKGRRELPASEIRRRLLSEKRMFINTDEPGVTYSVPDRTGELSTLQRYIELRFGQPLDELIWAGSLNEVADKLDIARGTVLRWRKRLAA